MGDTDSQVGAWLDLENAAHHHHLDRDTIRKVRQELKHIPEELAKTVPGEVLEYRYQLRGLDGNEIAHLPKTSVHMGDLLRKAESDQIAHIERIHAKVLVYENRLLGMPLMYQDAGKKRIDEFVSAAASLNALQVEMLGDPTWPLMVGHMGEDASSRIDDHARVLIDLVPELGLSLEEELIEKIDEQVQAKIQWAYWDTVQALWGIKGNLDPEADGWPWNPPTCRWCEHAV